MRNKQTQGVPIQTTTNKFGEKIPYIKIEDHHLKNLIQYIQKNQFKSKHELDDLIKEQKRRGETEKSGRYKSVEEYLLKNEIDQEYLERNFKFIVDNTNLFFILLKRTEIPIYLIQRYQNDIIWSYFFQARKYTEEYVDQVLSSVSFSEINIFDCIIFYQKPSNDFFEKYIPFISLKSFWMADLPFDFYRRNFEVVMDFCKSEVFNEFFVHYKNYITPQFLFDIRNSITKKNWKQITESIDFNDSFLEKLKNHLHWDILSKKIPLNRDRINRFKDCLDWSAILYNETFIKDEKLVLEFIEQIDTNLLTTVVWKNEIEKPFEQKDIEEFFLDKDILKHKNLINWKNLKNNFVSRIINIEDVEADDDDFDFLADF